MQNKNVSLDLLLSPKGVTVFGVLGVVAVCVSFYFFYLVSVQSKWVGTYARVTDGAVVHYGRRPHYYKVRLQYKYQVEGSEYTGECELSPANSSLSEEANSMLATYFPNGRALEIYYDPAKPRNSIGNKDEPKQNGWRFLAFGIISLAASFLINWLAMNKRSV